MLRLSIAGIRSSRLSQIALNLLFAVWMLQILMTGKLLPAALTDLLRPQHPIAAVSEPLEVPAERPFVGEFVPEA